MSDVQDEVAEKPDPASPDISETPTRDWTRSETGEKPDLDSFLSEGEEREKQSEQVSEALGENEPLTDDALAELLNESSRSQAIADGVIDPRDEQINAMRAA